MSAPNLHKPLETLHSESAPNLIDPHTTAEHNLDTIVGTNEENGDISSEESEVDLLEYLERKDHAYRNIQFKIPGDESYKCETAKGYEKRVSFDTINLQYDDDDNDDDLDNEYSFNRLYEDDYFSNDNSRRRESYFNKLDAELAPKPGGFEFLFDESRGRGRSKSPVASPLHSPSVSPARNDNRSHKNTIDLARIGHQKPTYPTQPIITHKGCTFTKLHRKFEDLYLNKLNNEENNFLKPTLPSRVILVYLSGRRHTWVALDWLLNTFIEHGDSIIIVSAINPNILNHTKKRKSVGRYGSVSPDNISRNPRARIRERSRPEYIKLIAKNIMNYAMEVINPNIISKISIELAVGKTKQVMKEMYKLYEPNLVCTGTIPRLRSSAPLRSWNSSRLTDRLVKNFPLPIIVVPAVNLTRFEKSLRTQIDKRHSTSTPMTSNSNSYNSNSSNGIIFEDDQARTGSSANFSRRKSTGDDQSISSMSSDDSYSSFEEITKTYAKYKTTLNNKLKDSFKENGYSEKFFVDSIKALSDSSVELCNDIIDIRPDFLGRGAKLAHTITGSARFGYAPYRTKSLLTPVESTPIEKSRTVDDDTPKVSLKDIKRKLKEKQEQQQRKQEQQQKEGDEKEKEKPGSILQVPHISVISPVSSNELSPQTTGAPKSSITFVENVKREKGGDFGGMRRLHKSLSHDDGPTGSRPILEPLKSHQDLTSLGQAGNGSREERSSKKKKSKFWKLFK